MKLTLYTDTDRLILASVVLSEKNLVSLLAKLYTEGSQKTLESNDVFIDDKRVPNGAKGFHVVVESNEKHYESRESAGPMHEVSEVVVELFEKLRNGDYSNSLDGTTVVLDLDPATLKFIQKGIT